jgi:hypothetical protein
MRCSSLRGARAISGCLLTLFLTLGVANVGFAQSNRANRDKQLEEMLKSLIESELQNLERRNESFSSAATQNTRVENARQIHTTLKTFSQDCSDLALALGESIITIPGAREHLTELYRLRARTALLAEKTEQGDQWGNLLEDIRSVDRDWRTTSLKISQLRGLNQNQTQLVGRLDRSSETLMGFLNARPQLNYFELTQALASLNTSYENLLEEISFEVTNPAQSRNLQSEVRKIQQQAQHMGSLIRDRSDYEAIRSEHARLDRMWDPIMVQLRRFDNRYIERSLRRISDANRSIQSLLWLPHQVDRQKLLYVTSMLKKDVDDFFARTPLKLLISLPDSEYVLPTADAFYGVCENFADSVERGENHQEMIDAFQYIAENEREFNRLFTPIRSQAAVNVLTSIDQHIRELKDALAVRETFDRRKAVTLGASLENLAEHLHMDTKLWLSHTNQSFSAQALAATTEFSSLSAEFHRQASNGATIAQLRSLSDRIHESWRKVHGYISLSQNEDRIQLARLATHIGPNLVEIRTLVQK